MLYDLHHHHHGLNSNTMVSFEDSALSIVRLGVFVFAIYASALSPIIIIALYACGMPSAAWIGLIGWLSLALIPLQWSENSLSRSFMRGVLNAACSYFKIEVKIEDEDALKPGSSYMLGYEPHHALPVG